MPFRHQCRHLYRFRPRRGRGLPGRAPGGVAEDFALCAQQPRLQQQVEMYRVADTVLINQETVYAPRQSKVRRLLDLKSRLNKCGLDPLRQHSLAAPRLFQGGEPVGKGPRPVGLGSGPAGLGVGGGTRERTPSAAVVSQARSEANG